MTEVDLSFPLIQNERHCIQQCLDRPTTCAAYVWKFNTPASVQQSHRTSTLYSQFNLPSDIAIEINRNRTLNKNMNAKELVAMGKPPRPVPACPRPSRMPTSTPFRTTMPFRERSSSLLMGAHFAELSRYSHISLGSSVNLQCTMYGLALVDGLHLAAHTFLHFLA
jgi:hypothetical protein